MAIVYHEEFCVQHEPVPAFGRLLCFVIIFLCVCLFSFSQKILVAIKRFTLRITTLNSLLNTNSRVCAVVVLGFPCVYWKRQLTYEFRKLMHLLFIPFMVAICFHSKALSVLGAVLLVWYLLDRLYFTTRM